MKYKILLISDLRSVMVTLQAHKMLISQLLKTTKIFFLDKNFRNIKNRNLKKKFNFNNNFQFLSIRNVKEFKKFLNKNKIVVWNNFGFGFKDFILHLIIKNTNTKQIIISNIGNIQWSLDYTNENFVRSYFNFIIKKISKLFMVFAVKFKIINKIDIRFQSGKKKSFHYKNFFVKNYRYVNSQFFDEYFNNKIKKEQKYITHIDANPNHEDDVMLRGKLSNKEIEKHYLNLNKHLKYLKNIFKKKIVVCIHPLYDLKKTKNFFPNFPVYKFRTKDFIEKSFLVTFFDSSVIFNAVYLKKNILIFKDKILGKNLYVKSSKYEKLLNILSIDILKKKYETKRNLLKKFGNAQKNNINYINNELLSYNNTPSYKEVLKFINNA